MVLLRVRDRPTEEALHDIPPRLLRYDLAQESFELFEFGPADQPERALARMSGDGGCRPDYRGQSIRGERRGGGGIGEVLSLLLDEVEEEVVPGSASNEAVLVGLVAAVVEFEAFGLKILPRREGCREGSTRKERGTKRRVKRILALPFAVRAVSSSPEFASIEILESRGD